MKRFLGINLVLAVLLSAGCNMKPGSGKSQSDTQPADTGRAVLKFDVIEHDFGRVTEGEKVGYIFTFRNEGTGNLLINNAVTSCGCTVPKYSKKPVAPGSTGSIEVVFDTSGRNGIQTKTVTVMSNAVTPVMLLQIKTEVIPKPTN